MTERPDPPIDSPELLSDHVEALIKEARYQAKTLREDTDREAIATYVVVVIPFGDANESLLLGGKKYRLEKPNQISARLKVEHSGFVTLNIQRFGSNFLEEVANPYNSDLRWLTKSCILYMGQRYDP